MTFYQELQLSSVGSKQLIKNTTDKKEKRRHILIYNFKVYLVMAFCVAVVTLFSKIFGADNSVPGVVVLLAVLVLRQADFGVRKYGQITMNRWDREELVKNLDLLERLVGKVPIYHLACDISEDAVKTLEQELVRDSSEEAAAAAFLQKNAMRKMEKKA